MNIQLFLFVKVFRYDWKFKNFHFWTAFKLLQVMDQ